MQVTVNKNTERDDSLSYNDMLKNSGVYKRVNPYGYDEDDHFISLGDGKNVLYVNVLNNITEMMCNSGWKNDKFVPSNDEIMFKN